MGIKVRTKDVREAGERARLDLDARPSLPLAIR